jgi:hypothetical protein
MAADDEQISLQVSHYLNYDVARITYAENFRYLYPCHSFQRLDIVVDFAFHKDVGTIPCILAQLGYHLKGKPARRDLEIVIVDTQHMQVLGGALGQDCCDISGCERMGTVPILVLERCC